jgi:uncharacterized protein YutE (UPF0331/DUF86 family)
MNNDVVLEKLDSLSRCIERIKLKCPNSLDQLQKDIDLQDIIVLNIQRAVQISVDIAGHIVSGTNVKSPETMAGLFIELNKQKILTDKTTKSMALSVAFRNVAVHEYDELDISKVYNVAKNHLVDIENFAKEILLYLKK